MKTLTKQINHSLENSISKACGRIAPSWPLKSMVAVNPYFGFTDKNFHETSRMLNALADIQLYMPLEFYKSHLDSGKILTADVKKALIKLNLNESDPEQILFDVHMKMKNVESESRLNPKTISDLSEDFTSLRTNAIMIECITNWLSVHFNETDQSWREYYAKNNVFRSWLGYASQDLTPGSMGLKNFHSSLKKIPGDYKDAQRFLADCLKLEQNDLTNYLLKLIYKLTGWSSYIAGVDWDNNLYKVPSTCLQEFLTVLLCWEYCIMDSSDNELISNEWKNQIDGNHFAASNLQTSESFELRGILQTALDFSNQRELIHRFNGESSKEPVVARPDVQAVFCIDVRSEVYRRHLESANSKIRTIGFAGFFGFPVRYERPGTNVSLNQCPVLLPSGYKVTESLGKSELLPVKVPKSRFLMMESLVRGFRKSPISSFGFVSPLGMFYLPKLLGASFKDLNPGRHRKSQKHAHILETDRNLELTFVPLPERIKMAENALRGMGLTTGFGKIVAFIGHGSSGVNNPHNAGLACGACGGNSGDINALTAAKILNDGRVRRALRSGDINIPDDTVFLAALHDTAIDRITILNQSDIKSEVQEVYNQFLEDLNSASESTRIERSVRFYQPDPDKAFRLLNRNLDWGQTRPEWGLARCSSFIIAPRNKTKGIYLGGESFLHDYNFNEDEHLTVLEGIMTAPMVVTSWINLQYYASSVDNGAFGGGNKTLHNVTSGIGVIEGSSGDLRIGLPMQSVHNGKALEHQPFRLNVVIDAPIEAINSILEKHLGVQHLFDNQWINLLRMSQDGRIGERYLGDLCWEAIS